MGVDELHPNLAAIVADADWAFPTHQKCRGCTIGVDGLIWLHDMARKHCVELLLEDNMQPIVDEFRDRAVRYAILGISLIIVLDGWRLGGKGCVDTSCARERLKQRAICR